MSKKTKNTTTAYLAEIFSSNGVAKIGQVNQVIGTGDNREFKRVNSRTFSRQLNKSKLVIK